MAANAEKMLVFVALVVMSTFLMNFATFVVVFFSDGSSGGGGGGGPSPVPVPTPAPTPVVTAAPTLPPTGFPTPFPTASPTESQLCDNVDIELGKVYMDEGDFVGLVYTGCPTVAGAAAFAAAAKRWSGMMAENTLTPINFGVEFDVADGCSFLDSFVVSGLEAVGFSLIAIQGGEIDGSGGILGQTSACLAEPSFLPIFGGIILDNADADDLEELGLLEDVAAREIGHALGFSRLLFSLVQQGGGQAPADPTLDLIDNAVFDEDGTVNYGRQPIMVGDAATALFSEATGTAAVGVPLEDGFDAAGVPIFDQTVTSGAALIDNHWDKEVFGEELMTFDYELGSTRPISSFTLSALADLGYTVDFAAAEDYSLPATAKLRSAKKETVNTAFTIPANMVYRLAADVLDL